MTLCQHAILLTTMSEGAEPGERDYVIRNSRRVVEGRSSPARVNARGRARSPLGDLADPGGRTGRCIAARPRRQGHHRTRLRHWVRLSAARSPCSSGRHRPARGATDDGLSTPGGARPLLPAPRGQRRGASPSPDASSTWRSRNMGRASRPTPLLIPEAGRVLRPGGAPIFPRSGTLGHALFTRQWDAPDLRAPPGPTSGCAGSRPDWPSVEFHLGYGDMIRLLRTNGFDIEDHRAAARADAIPFSTTMTTVSLEWSRRWPSEEIWKARKTSR